MQSYNSFALTTQAGTHLAYWITPSILTQVENISRSEAINVINEVANKYTISNNYFEKDKILRKVGIEVLSKINKFDIAFHWAKSGLINLLAPSILIDKTFRTLPHPSYYETGNILLWLKLIINNSEYHNYFFILCMASISSIFTIFSLIIGPIYIYKADKVIFYLTTLCILYFLLITGPVLSPKYILPVLPCIFLYQGITIFQIFKLLGRRIKKT